MSGCPISHGYACGAERTVGALGETKAKVRQTIQAVCPSEEARPRGRRIGYIGSREKPLKTRRLNQELEVGLRDHFSGPGGMKRARKGKELLMALPSPCSISTLTRAESKNYGI